MTINYAVPELPVLREDAAANPCAPVAVVLVAHLLPPLIAFLDALDGQVDVRAVLGVPYSNLPEIQHQVAQRAPVHTPPTLDALAEQALACVSASLRDVDAPTVLVEVGGYCAPAASQLAEHPRFLGAVEHTMQGHWRYAEQEPLSRPVLSIAASRLKALENREVGRSIAHTLEQLLRTRFHRKASDVRIGVLGFGGIGGAVARSLRKLDAEVWVHERCQIARADAILEGFPSPPRKRFLACCDVLLGATGQRSLTVEDLALARDGAIVASGSSKQVEIDVDGLLAGAESVDDDGVVRTLRRAGRTIHLVRDGQPVNFHSGNALGPVVDLVYTELYACLQQVAAGGCAPGLQELNDTRQQAIAEAWCRLHGGRRGGLDLPDEEDT